MIPRVLNNFNLIVDGRGYAGRVEELVPPKLTIKTEELRAGGMDAPIEIDMGMEKLECEFTLAEYDPEVLKLFGLGTGAPAQITLRGALDDETGNPIAIVIQLHGAWRELDFGTWKTGEKAPFKLSVAARYYKLTYDGKEIYEIDVKNMVRKIDGVDRLAKIRKAIGFSS